ncbi:hypothetical protein BLNAU_22722 [Blattamonas nauphoetae]|uniref:Uncharacterized protein n=1 Tax=Blattamonas nauphoetae TaxID=2049346 RepID=A0ABQ9WSA6_9EUKA|nr:hypothetical protein BLNAU_22722 [Blattamonas nauphoetae]
MFGGRVSEGLVADPTRNHNRMFISTLTDTFRCSLDSVVDSSATSSAGCSITPAGTFACKVGSASPALCSAGTTSRHSVSDDEKAVVFRSLVATIEFQSSLGVSLEAKVVNFLKSVAAQNDYTADVFLSSDGRITDESLNNFIQSIVVLLTTRSQVITNTAVEMLANLITKIIPEVRLALVKADLIPQLINTLNPLSLSFAEAEDIHINVMNIIWNSLWLATRNGLIWCKNSDDDDNPATQASPSEHFDLFLTSFGQQTPFVCDYCRLWHHFIVWFAGTIGILSRQSRSMVATRSFSLAAFLTLLVCGRQSVDWGHFVHLTSLATHPLPLHILDLTRSSADSSTPIRQNRKDSSST